MAQLLGLPNSAYITIGESATYGYTFEQTFDKKNKYTWRSFIVEPKEGLLVMFKSHLIHNVLQKNNNEKRISFAYNFKLNYSG